METFEKIIEQYKHLVHIAIRKLKIYKNFDHFEQTGLIALWEASQNFNGETDQFAGYAYTVIRYALLMELRTQHTYENRMLPTEDFMKYEMSNEFTTVFEQNEQIKYLLTGLKEEDRQLLMALYVQNLRYDEISTIMNVSAETLKKRRQRILKKLRNQLTTEQSH